MTIYTVQYKKPNQDWKDYMPHYGSMRIERAKQLKESAEFILAKYIEWRIINDKGEVG